MLQALPAVRIRYQGGTWPRAAPRWPWVVDTTQGSPGQQLLIPMAYQVLQNAGPLPARCVADPFPFGAWPVPADAVAMVIPCSGRRRGAADRHREFTGCCRPCRQSGSGTRARRGPGPRLDGPGWPALSRANLASLCSCRSRARAQGAHQVQLGTPERAPKGEVGALLFDGQS